MFNPAFFFNSASSNLSKNLLAYYKFENNVIDSTGLSPAATSTGVDYVVGKVNNAVRFDSSTDRVDIPDSNNFSFITTPGIDVPFTISMWVYFTAFSSLANFLINKRTNSAGNDEWQFFRRNIDGALAFIKYDRVNNAIFQGVATSTVPFSLNTWYHVVITDDGTKTNAGMNLYINSIQQTKINVNAGTYTGMPNGTGITRIGLNSWNLTEPTVAHQGYIDECCVWKNRELTQSEINYLYNSGNGRTYPL